LAAFSQADEQHVGKIPVSEIRHVLVDYLGESPPPGTISRALQEMKPDFDPSKGYITRNEFLALMSHRLDKAAEEAVAAEEEEEKKKHDDHHIHCCLYPLLHIIGFLVHFCGASRFDKDLDGDFDAEDLKLLIHNWEHFATSCRKKVNGKAKADFHNHVARKKLESRAPMTLKWMEGDWLVDLPDKGETTITVLEGGKCLYNGKASEDEENGDIYETGEGHAREIHHLDGWQLDLCHSSAKRLMWLSHDGHTLEWQRAHELGELTLQTLKGHWRVMEDKVECDDRVEVSKDGVVAVNGEIMHGEEILIKGHQVWRMSGWTADLKRSNADRITWTRHGEECRVEWHRPFMRTTHGVDTTAAHSVIKAFHAAEELSDSVFGPDDSSKDFEDEEAEKLKALLHDQQHHPAYIVVQCLICFILWAIFSIREYPKMGMDAFSIISGLDTIFPQQTDLRWYGKDCTSYRLEAWRWATYQFTHIGANHICFNCLLNLVLGLPLEALLGPWRMAMFFNVGVIGGALCSGFADPLTVTVGMSGGCYGIFGMQIAETLLNWRRSKFKYTRLSFFFLWLAVDTALHFGGGVKDSGDEKTDESVSMSAHFGGFMAGLAIGTVYGFDEVVTFKDHVLKAIAGVFGVVATVFCVVWIVQHPEPYPFWELIAGANQPSYWLQQVAHPWCFQTPAGKGYEYRCTRCSCTDTQCMTSLKLVGANASLDGWMRLDVNAKKCPKTFYNFADLENASKEEGPAAVDFASIPVNTTILCRVGVVYDDR